MTRSMRFMFLLRKTGDENSAVILCADTMLRGMIVTMVPLIGLGSDQANKSKNLEQMVESYHLDKFKGEAAKVLRGWLMMYEKSHCRTIILYISPMQLTKESIWCATLSKLESLGHRYICVLGYWSFFIAIKTKRWCNRTSYTRQNTV